MNLKPVVRLCLSLLLLSFIVTACQPAVVLTTQPAKITTPTQALPTSTKAPTQDPVPTLTDTPRTYWIDPLLPSELISSLLLPAGYVQTELSEDALLIIEPEKPGKTYLRQGAWVYALVAPFFTVQDDISYLEVAQSLNLSTPSEDLPISDFRVREEDFTTINSLFRRPASSTRLQTINESELTSNLALNTNTWMFLPFHQLEPYWKVISIDGVSPLDHNFEPLNYPLTVQFGMRSSDPSLDLDPGILPPDNYEPNQLTSLIMTGVTAMARDTAYEMEIQGVLYPGTEIRDVMRAADLTHISNEVSFYEGCKFPDPDYTGFIFCSNPEYIKLLDDLGADVIELTGNHNNDVLALYKVDSVPTTLDLYEEYGMQWYAGGTDINKAQAPLKIEHNGNKLAFIGCNSYGPEMAWASQDSSGAAPCEDWAWLKTAISNLRMEGYLPIVTLQYQEDYFQNASGTAVRDFRPLAEAGAVIVNGSQSHVAKTMEFHANAFVHYGLGNLFFDQPEFYITYDSFVQRHFFYQGKHISTQLLTLTIEDTAKPRWMTSEERHTFLFELFEFSKELRSIP